MKNEKECTHFGKLSIPPKEADCKGCLDIDKCLEIAISIVKEYPAFDIKR